MTTKKHFNYLLLLVGLLSCLCQNAWSQRRDALQEYLDQIALRQTEQVVTKGVQDGESITVPTGLTEVDLSQFSAAQNRTGALEIKASVKFVNGTISASGNYAGSDCLLKVSAGATVVLDATASVDAGATSLPLAAVGVYGGSTFYQCGDITAPNKGTGIAIYLSGATDSYNYVSGKTTGTISNPNGGTINGLDTAPEAYAVQSTDGTMLSFYYDGKKASREGQVFTSLKAQYDSSKKTYYMPWESSTITTVVFDKSFANYDGLTDMSYWFSRCRVLTTISGLEYVNTSNVTNMGFMFYNCSGLTSLDVSNFNTSNVTDMKNMFVSCYGLTSLDVSNFNTSNVKGMNAMFYNCSGLTSLDVSNFNTSNVTDMHGMFGSCSGLTSLDVSNFNTSKVTDMGFMFYVCSGLTSLDVSSFNTSKVTNMERMFGHCSHLTNLDVSKFNTSKVTNMENMFDCCSGLTSLDLSSFNTSNVTNMEIMFNGCSGLTTLDVSNFNTSNVTDMGAMFYGCAGLTTLDVSNFNTSKVTDMGFMFYGCSGLTSLDVSSFNTSKVTNMERMFRHCSHLTNLDVSNFNTSSVTSMWSMFDGCSGLKTIKVGDGWNTDNVTSSNYMFTNCTNLVGGDGTVFNSNYTDKTKAYAGAGGYLTKEGQEAAPEAYAVLSTDGKTLSFYYDGKKSSREGQVFTELKKKYDSSKRRYYMPWESSTITTVVFDKTFAKYDGLTDMSYWFNGCEVLTAISGLEYVNTSKVTTMWYMFNGCKSLTSLDVSNFNTSNVTNMESMFRGCRSLTTLDVSNFNTSSVTMMRYIFYNCSGLTSLDVSNFNTSNVTDMGFMFSNCSGLTTLDVSKFNTSSVTDMYTMFSGCSGLTTLNLSSFNTSSVTGMGYMFYGCSGLTTLDVSNFNTSNVKSMFEMFEGCSGLTSLDLSNFNTSNVTNMGNMFSGCSGLTSLDVSNFNTSNVTNMWLMFEGCSSLTSLDVSKFNTSNVTDMKCMFIGCSGLTNLDVSKFNTSKVTNMENMFDRCSGLTSLDLSSFNTSNVKSMLRMFYYCFGLQTIKVGDAWTTDNVTSSNDMFANCNSLIGGDGTVFDSNYTDKTKAYAGIGGYLTKDGQETSRYTKEELESALNSLLALLNSMDKNCQDAKTRYQNVKTYIDVEMQEAIYKDFNWYDAASANYHMEILVLKEDLSSSTVSGYDKIGDAIEITRKNITAIQNEARSKLESWQEAVKAAAAADLQAKLDALGAKLTEQHDILSKQRNQCEGYNQWKDYYFCKRLDSQTLAELEKLYNQVLSAEKDNYDKINSYNTLIKSSSISSVEDIGGIYKEYEALAAKVDAIDAEVETCRLALSAIETTYNSIPVNFPDESLAFTIAPQGISKDIQMGYKSNRGFVLTSSGKMRFEQVDGANFLLRDMNGNYIVATKNSPDLTAGTKEEATVWTGRCNGFSNGKGLYTFYSDAASRYLTCVYGDVNAEITASGSANYGYWTIEESTLDDLQAFMNLLEEEQSSGSGMAETDTLTIVLPQFDEDTTPTKPFVFPVRPGPIHVIIPTPGLRFWPIPNPVPGQRRPKDFHPIEIPKGCHVILDDITFRDLIGGDHVIYVEGIVEINVTVKVFIENWEWFVHVGPGGKVIWRTDPDGNGKRPRLMNDEGGTIDMEGGYIGYIDNSGTMNHRLGTIDHVINRKTYYFTGGIVCYVDNRGHWLHSKGTAYRVRNAADCTYEMTGGEINNMTGSVTDTVFVNYGRFLFRDGWMRGYGSRFIYHYRKAYLYIDGGRFDFTHIRNYFIEAHEDFYIRGDYDYAPPVPYLLRPSVTIRVLYRWIYKFNIVFIDGRPTPRYPLFRGEDFDLSRDHYRYIDWDLPSKRWRWYYNPGDNTIEPRDEEVYDEDDLQAYLNWLAENRSGEAASTEDEPQTLSLGGREIIITQPVELPVGTHVLIVDGSLVPREAWTHDRMFYVPKTSTVKFVNVVFDFSSKTHYIVSGVPMPRYIFHIYGDVRFGADCRILGYYDNTRVATDDYIPGAMIAAAPGGRLWIDGAHFDGVTFLVSEEVNIYVMSRLINHIYVYVPTTYRHKGFRFMAPWQDYRIDLTDLEFVKLVNADDWTADIDEDGNVFLKNVNETGIRSISCDADEQYPAYDLQGRKVINSSRGQMFIRNGKKYVGK